MDGFTDYRIAFAIDLIPSQTSFVLIDNDLKQAQAFYSYFTGDGSSRWLLLTQGKINGTKINNTTWNVSIHIFSGPFTDINKNFIIQ